MVKPVSQTPDTQHLNLRPRARLLRTIGDELISSETVAVIELVKNAYDADATRVAVRFNAPLEAGRGSIEVIDNGHGMSFDTIRTAWMEPATPVKRRRNRSEQRARRMLGEKGIGRFATSRLADFLEVVSRRADADREVRVFFDWSQFNDEQKYLDEIEILWEEVPPSDISPSGDIRNLWEEEEQPQDSDLTHGTILRMQDLTIGWEAEQLQALRAALARLVSPFLAEEQIDDEFQISLQLPAEFEYLSGRVQPPEALKNPPYLLKGVIDGSGRYKFTMKVKGEEEHVEDRFVLRGRPPQCGPFGIELRVWDRDEALGEVAREYGSTITDVRRDLNEAAGINVYRDGFRVLPYGEPRNDWLRLDARRVQNPTQRLSNNQVVGYVLISSEKNPQLRDQSNREGLIEGPALDDLRELIKKAMTELETRRARARRKTEQEEGRDGGLFADFDLKSVRDFVRRRHPEDSELLRLVGEKDKDLERRVEKVQEVISRYRRLATLGRLIDTVLHDGRAPLAKIRNEARLGIRDVERAQSRPEGFIQKLRDRFDMVSRQSDALKTVFDKIEPFGGRKRARPTRVRLEQVIADAFAVLDGEIEKTRAQVKLPDTDTQVTVDPSEVQEIIVNLLDNSLYWLLEVPEDARRIAVEVNRLSPDTVSILFSDSGPGVKPRLRENIFEPYFSDKPDGAGQGLAIAGEIIKEHYGGELELVEGGPLPGATFRITLRRRV
jgi:signal transduction histidine kinase